MSIYPYTNAAGEEREIVEPMSNAPPEFVRFDDEGNWIPVDDEHSEEDGVWSRVYGAGHVGLNIPDFVCKAGKDGLPVSVSSPRKTGGVPRKIGRHTVMEHKDGTITNRVGQPIIDSNAAARNNAARTGMELD